MADVFRISGGWGAFFPLLTQRYHGRLTEFEEADEEFGGHPPFWDSYDSFERDVALNLRLWKTSVEVPGRSARQRVFDRGIRRSGKKDRIGTASQKPRS